MGWTEGKGLGATESGETGHVKVRKRAQNLGELQYIYLPIFYFNLT